MQLLVGAFNPAAAEGIMCRSTISVGWDGRLFDCDFNQQLDMPLVAPPYGERSTKAACFGKGSGPPPAGPLTVFDLSSLGDLTGMPIASDNHCFGCTAGAGSSCTGAVA